MTIIQGLFNDMFLFICKGLEDFYYEVTTNCGILCGDYRYDRYHSRFIVSLVLYLPLVFGLKYYVDNILDKNQKPYISEALRSVWVAWCVELCIFSFFGFYHTAHYLIYETYETDLFSTTAGVWYHLFIISKIFELFDTVIIVLRSKPLVALQYWHHWCTLAICYYASFIQCDIFLPFFTMNYFVHVFMYGYFAFYSLYPKGGHTYGKVRKIIGNFVNVIQTLQMVFAIIYAYYCYLLMINHKDSFTCAYEPDDNEINNVFISGVFMYFSYFVLFLNVFFDRMFDKKVKLH